MRFDVFDGREMAKTKRKSKYEKLSFQQALEKVDEIADQLASGQTELEETLANYEEGIGLLKHCYSVLQNVEKKIQLLTSVDPNGAVETEEFDNSATTMDESGKTRTRKRSTAKNNPKSREIDDESTLF